ARSGRDAVRVWFADLAPVAEASGISAAVAEAAGLRDPSGARLVDAMAELLGDDAALLVLDHCDHVLAAGASLAGALLSRCRGLRILATSREWLGAPGEQTLRVPPLSLLDPEQTPTRESVRTTESGRLFEACAGASREFRLTDANAGVVAGLCRDLDGVP